MQLIEYLIERETVIFFRKKRRKRYRKAKMMYAGRKLVLMYVAPEELMLSKYELMPSGVNL